MGESIVEIILDKIYKFEEKTGKKPKTIYMTTDEIFRLNSEIAHSLIFERKKHLKESLLPELLPPFKGHVDIGSGAYVFGVKIIENEKGGFLVT